MIADTHSPTEVRVSAFLITFNNERTVERALRSVAWADEIVVVDSHSTDRTREICARCGARILEKHWPGFRDQYQFAADQCAHRWAVFIDADEEMSPDLADEMQRELAVNFARPEAVRVAGFHGHRRTFYLGRWIEHGSWVPDHEIRLYDRELGRWEGGLHAAVKVRGPEAHLRNFYYHYTHEDFADHLRTIDRYTTNAAEDMIRSGKRFSLLQLLLKPPARFLRDYVFKRGFRDGLPGFVIAVSTAFYVFARLVKVWESQEKRACMPGPDAPRPRPPKP